MAIKTLLSQTGVVGAGATTAFPGSDNIRTVQFNPLVGAGFSGSVVIEGSYAAQPGNNDFVTLATVTFTAHTQNLSLDIQSDAPNLRARIASSQTGAIAVYASSRTGSISGSQGSLPATAVVESALKVAGTGSGFNINSPVVPSFTSDDVVYANDFNKTLTDILDGTNGAVGKQDKIGTGVITASEADINVLAGAATYGLVAADVQKLADLNASATEINRVIGVTSNVQTQLNTLSSAIPAGIAGQTTTGTVIDNFFDAVAVVSISDLNNFSGLTASAADLNVFTTTAGDFTAADLEKLGDITASAADLNKISGFTGTNTDLNKLVGMTASTSDLNAITGLSGTTVTTTQLAFLSGLTQNVQAALSALPNLAGLSASVNDLNTLSGIFSGSGAYPAQISATEISYLNGVSSNIQTQLDNKRTVGVPIGIAEISGAAITTTELNYLQGATSNIQAQINSISAGAITPAGGTFTGSIYIPAGSAAAPGLGFAAPSQTTGLYKFGASGIGFAVSGTRFVTFDGTDLVVGTGAANGSPLLKGVGFGVTDPAHSFVGDTDTGVYWVGANSIGIAAGGAAMAVFDQTAGNITLGGAVANNVDVSISGVFAGEKVLGRATVDGGSVSGALGATTLYTIPTGRTAIITKILCRLTSVVSFSNGALFRMNIGTQAGTGREIVDNTANTGIFNPAYSFNTAGQVLPLGTGANAFPDISGSSGAAYGIHTAGTVIEADITVLAGANTYEMEIIVIGHEF